MSITHTDTTINATTEEIVEALNAALTAAPQTALDATNQALSEASSALGAEIGDLSGLETEVKSSLVAALNELFTYASEGKTAIAAALAGKGQAAAADDTFSELAADIGNLKPVSYVDPGGYCKRMIVNDGAVTPTGSYATSTYYDTSYGVKIGYCPNGDVLVSMKSGTTTSYENLNFTLPSAPSGVTIKVSSSSWDTSNPAGQLYVCVISGLTSPVQMSIAMGAYNSTNDYTTCAITLTEA